MLNRKLISSRKINIVFTLFLVIPFIVQANTSTCYGTTSNGRIENAVQLPESGNNFVSYSTIAHLAGRTYVHSEVRDIILGAYKDLESTQPGKVSKYAETGFKKGGQFKPHITHRNGLSVDFMTPVINARGQSVHLPTHPFNKMGYNIEFDKNVYHDGLRAASKITSHFHPLIRERHIRVPLL